MEYVIVGLGNPGKEYETTRHNVGRMVVARLQEEWQTSDWRDDKTAHAKISQGTFNDDVEVQLVLPETYMNRSGGSVVPLVKNKKNLERLIVIHDDIDLGLGTVRIAYNRGAGGHNGVTSIEQAVKSRAFTRVRVGVIPTAPDGTLKKPKGEKGVYDFILKRLTNTQKEEIAHIVEEVVVVVRDILEKGRMEAMCEHNGILHHSIDTNA